MEAIDKKVHINQEPITFKKLIEIAYWLNRPENTLIPSRGLVLVYSVSELEFNNLLNDTFKAKGQQLEDINTTKPIELTIKGVDFQIIKK